MFKAIPLRQWATPLTIGSFILMAATGVLMFFEYEAGLTTVVHQWFSWLFLMGAVAHIVCNVRPFKNHLKSRWGKVSIATFVVVFVASFFSWGLITGPQLLEPIELALVDAPVSALAGVTRVTPEVLIARFKQHGITASGEQSLRELASQYGVDEIRLAAIVFRP
jgi:hypothetical protein